MNQKPPEFNRARAIDRTKELQLIKDIRKWTASEKAEFNILLEQLMHDSRARYWREREQTPQLEERGVH